MAMRVTGMMSGLDTESIIQELVAAKQTKVDTAKKEQTKIEWRQEAWKDLNTKLKKLYNGTLGNLRYQSSFSKKTTKISDSSVAEIVTGDSAMNNVQSLRVAQLAKSGYLTGAEIKANDGEKVTSGTLLTDLGIKSGSSFKITTGGKETTITVDDTMTLGSLSNKLAEAGVNANFDSATQRFFIGAKESGKDADFSFEADGLDGEIALTALGLTGGDSTKIDGQDAEIYLNKAKFTSSKNTFEINGLTITCNAETGDKEVTLTTQNDTSGIYDMIKSFIKEYSELINEMDKLYNADSAKGYEPLTDEEKDAMSETEAEKWEQKIKDSLLRRDSNLNTVSSSLKEIMASGFEINGKTMYLYDFGIETQGYFEASDNEKNAYHIKGDADDSVFSGEANKLQAMINSNPDTVTDFFVQLSRSLYGKMSDMMSSVKDTRTYGNLYDDLKLKNDYNDYTSKIADLEEKLKDYEDKWYSKFSKMETALAKMQSNSSAITGLLGG